ncbi:MAG: hypothetical protein EU550_02730 [Promethearchaeota archaeon]|nr:MAG: hypothetical protein EU550_02730 [Candidatus Lokiarchaeota archaeon]
MDKQVVLKIVKSKIGVFIIQILILTISIVSFGYSFPIEFDSGITCERKMIIQFLGNYILVDTLFSALFLYSIWFLVGMIPIVIFKDSRKALGANLKLVFFPNFFFYLFLSKYSPNYFNTSWLGLFTPFAIFAIIIIVLTILIPKIYQILKPSKEETKLQELLKMAEENRYKCPNCGATFESKPIYCYRCSTRLIPQEGEKQKENT